jgi:hypothetical protein
MPAAADQQQNEPKGKDSSATSGHGKESYKKAKNDLL